MGATTCLICGAKDHEVSKMHSFPANRERSRIWQEKLGFKYTGESLNNRKICSRHFAREAYLDLISYKLRRDAVPIPIEDTPSTSQGDYVTLVDSKSRYGTLHQNIKVVPEQELILNNMDVIQFGIFKNIFRFEAHKFIVAASALSAEKKAVLKENLVKCNAKYVDKWCDSCTHLVVENLTLTIKVLQALIEAKPIVTLAYWADYARSIERKTAQPDISKYNKPPIGEQLLRSDFDYTFHPERRTLFSNKVFIFLKSKTKKLMEGVIKSCGGTCISWEEEPKTIYEINRSPIEHLLIKTDNDENNLSFDSIIKELSKVEKRPIPINEIALAIVNCSCDVNCNPSFNKLSQVFKTSTQHHHRDVLAKETQSQYLPSTLTAVKTERVIPPSLEDDWTVGNTNYNKEEPGPSGIKRSIFEGERVISKKPKLENNVENGANQVDSFEKNVDAHVLDITEKSVSEKNDRSKQSKLTTFIGRQPSKVNSTDNGSPKENTNQSTHKRKAPEDNDLNAKRINPFSSIIPSTSKRSKPNEQNPFDLIKSSKPEKQHTPNSVINPFASILNISTRTQQIKDNGTVKPERVFSDDKKFIPRNEESLFTSSKSIILNASWMSKASFKVVHAKEEDPDLAKISKAFRDCVKVEVITICERTVDMSSYRTADNVDGKKNFKKFRKVQPLKPQVTIINHRELKKIAPGDISGIEISNNRNDSEDENDSTDSRQNKPVKTMGKRFVL